ncbi:PAS domain-containing protein [Myxococcaceae bacterium GXIMD 01537]
MTISRVPAAASPGGPVDPEAVGPSGAGLLDSITDGVLWVDPGWRIAYVNTACEAVVDRPRSELVGRALWEEFPGLEFTPFGAAFRRAVESGERTTVADYYPRLGAWLEARAFPSKEGLVIFLRDMTEAHRAEAERTRLLAAERVAREAAERNAARLTRLQELSARLSLARAPEEVLGLVVGSAMDAAEAHSATIALPLAGGTRLALSYQGRVREGEECPAEVSVDAPVPLAHVFRTGEPEWLESPYAFAGRYPHLLPMLLNRTDTRAAACLPIAGEGRTLGVLSLSFPEARPFTPFDREFLLALGRHCALALERVRLTAEADTQRARLEDVVMQAPAVVSLTLGPEHRFLFCNPLHRQLHGGRDFTGRAVHEALSEEELPALRAMLDTVYATGEPLVVREQPERLARPGRAPPEERFLHRYYQPLRGTSGRVEGVAGWAFDVTDQVRARHTVEALLGDLARSEERFRSLVTATSDILWDTPPQGEFVSDQPGWRAFTGQSRERLLGWGWLEAVHPEDREATVRAWQDAVSGRKPLHCEHRLRRHDGVYRHMLVRAVPVLEADGTVREWVGLHRDITAQREDEAERARLLLRARRHGAQLQGLATASLAICEADTVERVLRAITEQAREVIGAHQCVTSLTSGESWAQAINEVSLSDKYSEWHGFTPRPDGSGIYARVCRLNRPMRLTHAELEAHPGWRGFGEQAGEQPPMRGWLAAPLVSRSGKNLGLIQLSDRYEGDFTAEDEAVLVQLARMASVALENARLMAETQAANRAKDEFLAVMSHELRTPLTAVLGWTQMLRARRNEPAALDKGLEVIERNARTLAQLIEDVLDVSRIITGKLALHRRVVDLAGVVGAALEVVRPHAEQKAVALHVDVGPGGGPLLGDPGRLQQVFWNLLVNAVKFTPSGGRVDVELRREEDSWAVRVRDSGQGIRPENLTRLFERFWQADGSSTREHGGLGLGLAIVHHLVGLHGGSVSAHSAGPGLGATFQVRLPVPAVLPEPEPAAGASAEAGALARLDGVGVLLVEDAPDARELIALLLRERGAVVRTTASAREALEALAAEVPDVLVSDIGLPGEDGHSLLQRARAWAEPRDVWVPAIALTAYAGPDDVRRAYRAGFQVHLAKPLEPASLVEAVARLAARDGGKARAG